MYVLAALPSEILMYIFRWVVSSDLDMRALEQLSLVCRGFYICARSAASVSYDSTVLPCNKYALVTNIQDVTSHNLGIALVVSPLQGP